MPQLILGSFEGDWFEVRTPEQARLLSDPESQRLLAPFIGHERSASAAAAEIGCSVERLLYRIRQFERAGLLREVRREPRRGRPVRIYRAAADGFLIPFELTPFEDHEARIRRQQAPTDRLRARAGARLTRSTGLGARRLYRDHVTGELNEETALPPGASTEGLHGDRTALVRLSREDADALGRELVETFDRYAARRLPEGQGQTYLVQIALLPVSPEDEP